MLDLAIPDDRHRLDPAMRVIREPGFVVRGTPRLEVVEEQEGVEMVESAGSEAPAEMHAGAFDHGLRRHELRHSARGLTHGSGLLVDVTLPSGGSYHSRPLALVGSGRRSRTRPRRG